MPEFDNTNRGALFANDRRQKDTDPEYSGTLNVNGSEFTLSAWIKESKKTGKKYFSLSVRPRQDRS